MKSPRNRGFVLLFVVMLLPLVAVFTMMLTANSRRLWIYNRLETLDAKANLACESGIVWASAHSDKIVAMNPRQEIRLDLSEDNLSIVCTIQRDDSGDQIEFCGRAEDRSRGSTVRRTSSLNLLSTRPLF